MGSTWLTGGQQTGNTWLKASSRELAIRRALWINWHEPNTCLRVQQALLRLGAQAQGGGQGKRKALAPLVFGHRPQRICNTEPGGMGWRCFSVCSSAAQVTLVLVAWLSAVE